jgi:hypothetical protein
MRLPNQDVRAVDSAGRASETDFKFKKSIQRFMWQAQKLVETASVIAGKVLVGSPTGADKGDGTVNAEKLYEDGKRVFVQSGIAEDGGLSHVPYDHGTVTSGTVTIDPSVRLHHKLVCGGAITISPAATNYHGTALLHIANNAGAGDKTMSGFIFAQTGNPFTNTNGHKFWVALFFAGADGCDYRVQKRQA